MYREQSAAIGVTIFCLVVPFVVPASDPPTLRAVRGRFGLIEEVREVWHRGLPRIQDRDELVRFITRGDLVRVPDRGEGFAIDPGIGSSDRQHRDLYKHARPAVRDLVAVLGIAFARVFRSAFQLNSLVRSVGYQRRLARTNPTAAQARSFSSHTTGFAFDVAKPGMRSRELRWFRTELLSREGRGEILATEERGCFHVLAFPAPPQPPPVPE